MPEVFPAFTANVDGASKADAKASADEREKHQNFVARMVAKGYTEKQVRLLAEWYLRVHKSS